MRRIIATGVAIGALSVPFLAAPAAAHDFDPLFGNCNPRGDQLVAAVFGQWDDPADRNGDGVVCWYVTRNGKQLVSDNHIH